MAISFLQSLKQAKEEDKFYKFLEIFQNVQINISLVEVLQGMPQYFKFLKEAVSRKKKVIELEVVHFADLCSVGVERRLPPKVEDPGSFTILCVIGEGNMRYLGPFSRVNCLCICIDWLYLPVQRTNTDAKQNVHLYRSFLSTGTDV